MSPEVTAARSGGPAAPTRWRTVDIVVAAVIGVAFGVVFAGWNALWAATGPTFTAFPPAQAFMYGMWLVPGVLGGLVVRKRGAAVFTEVVAACVSVFFGTSAPLMVVLWGLLQGLGAEVVFAAFRYRSWRATVALLAGTGAGFVPAVLDNIVYNAAWAPTWMLVYGVLVVLSGLVLAGAGSVLLVRALARTGVLAPFASGREQTTT